MPDLNNPNDPNTGQIPPLENADIREAQAAPEEKSTIQTTMEDALDRSLASADDAGAPTLKTYPISDKMRTRLLSEFMYHPPSPDQIPRYLALRSMALTFATMIVELTPPSREQSLALTKIGEAIMHACAAIARGEVAKAVASGTGSTPEAAVIAAGDFNPDPAEDLKTDPTIP